MRRAVRQFRTRRFRAGGYTVFATALVIAIAVAVNMLVGALPESLTKRDFTQAGVYSISDQTKRIVSAVDRDVTLYLVTVEGSEDEMLETFLNRYADLSDHVRVETLDPLENPAFLKSFGLDMSLNSVIVQSGERSRVVDYNDIFVYDYSYDYYTGAMSSASSFNGEQEITSAIYYVVSDTLPKIYTLEGHGETALSDAVLSALSQQNMESEPLSLLTAEAVPEDAAALVIAAPTRDLSGEEAAKIKDYLASGGKVTLFTDMMDAEDFPNLLSVTEAMGATVGEGMIVEGDADHCVRGYSYYLLPDFAAHAITAPLAEEGFYVLTPMAQPLVALEETGAVVTPLLTTSETAYAKKSGYDMETTAREEGDADGPFTVGLVCEKDAAQLVWYATPLLLDGSVNSVVGGGNYDLFLNTLGYVCQQEESIAIRAKSLDVLALVVPQGTASVLSAVMVGVLPAVLIAAGVVIAMRRKRR